MSAAPFQTGDRVVYTGCVDEKLGRRLHCVAACVPTGCCDSQGASFYRVRLVGVESDKRSGPRDGTFPHGVFRLVHRSASIHH